MAVTCYKAAVAEKVVYEFIAVKIPYSASFTFFYVKRSDLKMVAGIAKWVRDATADVLQREAEAAAPLAPGEAFAGVGGRYRFKVGVLAVVMDEQKRTRSEWIRDGIARAIKLARDRSAWAGVSRDTVAAYPRAPVRGRLRAPRCARAPIARIAASPMRRTCTNPPRIPTESRRRAKRTKACPRGSG